jgi:hypothetical protein
MVGAILYDAQRPQLAAVLAFEKRRARQLSQIELLILKIIQL